MSFRVALRNWILKGQRSLAASAFVALRSFAALHPRIYANLNRDRLIALKMREGLLKQLATVAASVQFAVESKIESFCRANQYLGPREHCVDGAPLGHVEARLKFERTFTSTAMPTSPLTRHRGSASLFVDSVLQKDVNGQRDSLRGVPLCTFLMWSFYDDHDRMDPFSSFHGTKHELIRRLGLGGVDKKEELLIWSHVLPNDHIAKKPTAFDAGMNRYYHPGGRTRPLRGADGVPEVVHPPITGDSLAVQIVGLT